MNNPALPDAMRRLILWLTLIVPVTGWCVTDITDIADNEPVACNSALPAIPLQEPALLDWLSCPADATFTLHAALEDALTSTRFTGWTDQALWIALSQPLQPGSAHEQIARYWLDHELPAEPVRDTHDTLFHRALEQTDPYWITALLSPSRRAQVTPDILADLLRHSLEYPVSPETLRALIDNTDITDDLLVTWLAEAISRHQENLMVAIWPRIETLHTDTLPGNLAQPLFNIALTQAAPVALLENLLDHGAALPPPAKRAWHLWHAAQQERQDLIDWWLQHHTSPNADDADGFIPLHFANTRATRLLLDAGASPNARGRAGHPMFHHGPVPENYPGGESISAAKAKLLLDAGYTVGQTDSQDHTALANAVRHGDLALAQRLIDAGENPWQLPKNEKPLLWDALKLGRLPLVQAIARTRDHFLGKEEQLLLDYVKEPDARSDLVEALIVAGLPLELTDEMGDTALTLAARRKAWPLADVLLRYGANPQHLNHLGCGLQCYAWDMPQKTQQLASPRKQGFIWPDINLATPAFFALAFAPMLLIWLAYTGWQLARYQTLLPAALMMLGNLLPWWLIGSVMYFHCDPCAIKAPDTQSQSLMMLSALTLGLTYYWWENRKPPRTELNRTEFNNAADAHQ